MKRNKVAFIVIWAIVLSIMSVSGALIYVFHGVQLGLREVTLIVWGILICMTVVLRALGWWFKYERSR